MAFWDHEPAQLYDFRQSTFEQFKLKTDFAAQALETAKSRIGQTASQVGSALSQFGQEAGPAAAAYPGKYLSPGTLTEPLQTSGFNIPGGLLGTAGRSMESIIGRPMGAVRAAGAAAFGLGNVPGEGPGAAAGRILGGAPPEPFSNVLGRAGMPEIPISVNPLGMIPGVGQAASQIFPDARVKLPFGVRDIAGMGVEMLDPTIALPGGLPGKAGGALFKGATRLAPGLERFARPAAQAATAASDIVPNVLRNITLDEELARAPTALGQQAVRAGELPLVGGAIKRVGETVVSPRVMAPAWDPAAPDMGRLNVALSGVLGNMENIQHSLMDSIRSVGQLPGMDDAGRFIFTGAEKLKPVAAGDVFQSPEKYRNALQPYEYDAIVAAGQGYDQILAQVRPFYDTLLAKHPDVAKNFEGLFAQAKLGGAERFFPRYVKFADGTIKRAWKARPGQLGAADMERQYVSAEDLLAKGKQYLDPLEGLNRRAGELLEDAAYMQVADKLADAAKHVTPVGALDAAKNEITTARATVTDLRFVQNVLASVGRGEAVIPSRIQKIRDLGMNSVADELEHGGVMSQAAKPLPTGAVPPVETPPWETAQAAQPLNAAAQALLKRVDAGGVPTTITASIRRIAGEHGIPITGATTPDDVIAGLRAKAARAGGPGLPPEPGVAPIPEGNVRLYHQTGAENAAAIARQGLRLENAKGVEGPRGIYATEKPFYGDVYGSGSGQATVEFSVPKERFAAPQNVLGDVTPADIIGVHHDWHETARYIENDPATLKSALSGAFDDLGGKYEQAVAYLKQKYSAVPETMAEVRARVRGEASAARVTPSETGLAPGAPFRTAVPTARLRALQEELTARVGAATEMGVKPAKEALAGMREAEAQATSGLGQVAGARFQNIWIAPEEAKRLTDLMAKGQQTSVPFWGGLEKVSDIMRTLQTTADISAPFIQGIPALASRPHAFLQGFAASVAAWVDPASINRFIGTNPTAQEVYKVFPTLARGTSEQVAGATAIEGALTGKLGPVGQLGKTILERSQASFDAFGTVTRVYWADAMKDVATKTGKTNEIADLINHATGVLPSKAMGFTPQQRAMEAAILFSPRYLRSAVSLIGDMAQGGPVGEESRRAISSMLIAGAIYYPALAHMVGQKPVLDPSDSRFMTLDLNGYRVGIGTTWIALAKLLVRGMLNPGALKDWDPDNPLMGFALNRLAPIPSTGADLWRNERFGGQETHSPQGLLRLVGTKALPMALGSIADEGLNPANLAGQLTGLRTFEQTPTDLNNQVAQEKFGTDYANLSPTQSVQVQTDPRIAGKVPTGGRFERQRTTTGIYERYNEDIATATQQLKAGQLTGDDFRRAVDKASVERNVLLEDTDRRLGPATRSPYAPEVKANEQAYQKYVELLKVRDAFDRRDPEAIDSYLASLPAAQRAYITEKQTAAIGRLPPEAQQTMTEMRAAQDTLQQYYDLRQEALDQYGLWDEYKNATPARQEEIRKSTAGKAAARLETRLKDRLRRYDPDIDEALVTWHGATPIRQRR